MAYNPKSCNALEKPFYRPVEAAIRWCELTEYEPQIMAALGDAIIPTVQQFPKWPCLAANAEKILHAIQNGGINHGRDGKNVPMEDHVAPARLTVSHPDLKAWMSKHYPDAKPPFLFDETERKTHSAINPETFAVLDGELQAARAQRKRAEEHLCDFAKKHSALESEHAALQAILNDLYAKQPSSEELHPKREKTLFSIIYALLGVIDGGYPSDDVVKHPSIKNQSDLVTLIAEAKEPGLSKRNLEEYFATANKEYIRL